MVLWNTGRGLIGVEREREREREEGREKREERGERTVQGL